MIGPIESALFGVVAEEPNARGGKCLEDISFRGRLQRRIGRSAIGLDPPSAEQRVTCNGHHCWAVATPYPVVAALPEDCRERSVVVGQTVPQLDPGRVYFSDGP